ncbi:hypothetical protein GCM10028786_21670 [Flaviaesturariibacter terrae]
MLRTLSLRGNELDSAQIAPVFRLTGLTDLDLDDNKLEALSAEIRKLQNLHRLSVSRNPLANLPQELTALPNLEQLGLGDLQSLNWLESFAILQRMHSLRRVGMFEMRLRKMPDGFGKLQQIDTFWLTFNLFDKQERQRITTMVPNAKVVFD